MVSGKRLLLEVLRQEGVDFIFGNPGTTELPLMDALATEDHIHYVLGLQEATVLGMADGFAQASGRLAMASLHAAPGLGNAIGALHNAAKAGAPVLVTAGQQDLHYNFTEPNLWGDLPRIAQPFVKWSYEIQRFGDLPRAIHRAAKVALTPPTGPVFLSLPADLLSEDGEAALGKPTRVGRGLRADRGAIAAAAALLARAERPVIVAGDAVAQSGAAAELVALAEAIGAPVFLEGMPNRMAFPPHHGLFRGPLVRLAEAIRATLEPYDLLVSVGGDLFTLAMPGHGDPMPPGMAVVHLDSDPWELGKNYPADAALLGDPGQTLPELVAAVQAAMVARARSLAAARCSAEVERGHEQLRVLAAQAAELEFGRPVHPLALSHALADLLPPDAVVVDEGITSAQGLHRFLRSADPKSYFGGRGGGIGWGMPAAVGIKLALPERPMVALIGDGSAMYSIQALYSAAREKLDIVFVVANNASYRIIKQRIHAGNAHAAQTGRYIGVDLDSPPIDHVAIARGFGLAAERVDGIAAFRAACAAALGREGPALIEVAVEAHYKPL
jgi:benzoylformate decarboxylase